MADSLVVTTAPPPDPSSTAAAPPQCALGTTFVGALTRRVSGSPLGATAEQLISTAQRLGAILTDIAGPERTTADLSADFGADAADALDKLF